MNQIAERGNYNRLSPVRGFDLALEVKTFLGAVGVGLDCFGKSVRCVLGRVKVEVERGVFEVLDNKGKLLLDNDCEALEGQWVTFSFDP